MTRTLILGAAVWYAGLSLILVLAPAAFYQNVPGVAHTGPFNSHFMRDVGLAFGLSAAALVIGVRLADRRVALFGAGFPALHGGYHLFDWALHGLPLTGAALTELLTTTGLGALVLVLTLRMKAVTP